MLLESAKKNAEPAFKLRISHTYCRCHLHEVFAESINKIYPDLLMDST